MTVGEVKEHFPFDVHKKLFDLNFSIEIERNENIK